MTKMKFYWPLQSRYVFWVVRSCHHTCKTRFCVMRSQLHMCTEIMGPISIKLDVLLMATLQPTACTNSSSRSLHIMTMCCFVSFFVAWYIHPIGWWTWICALLTGKFSQTVLWHCSQLLPCQNFLITEVYIIKSSSPGTVDGNDWK